MLVRLLILAALSFSLVAPAQSAEQSLGQAIKKIFATPTPTPKPHKKKSAGPATKKKSPSPTPTPAKKSSPPREKESESPSPAASAKKHRSPAPEEESETPSPTPKKRKSSPTPSPTASPHRKKKTSPTPPSQPFETPTPTPSPSLTPREGAAPSSTPAASAPPEAAASASISPPKKHGVANASLKPDAIKGFENYPPNVQKMLTTALDLTTRNLDYKYGSDDPANGGMDCSGFVYYVLKESGVKDVPRDSSEQYVWLRRARTFEPVLSQRDDSFELDTLKPGDLLFWTGTYAIERDPPITHAMIYLGREKRTGERVMVGASDGRVYQGESRFGVSVFDFKIQRSSKNENGKLHPTFVGYGHVPGLTQ